MKAKPAPVSGGVTIELGRRDEAMMDAATRVATSPFKIQRILVPVDFSECSKKALAYALALAKEHRATITLLHVSSLAYGAGEYGGVDYGNLESDAKEAAGMQLAKLGADEVGGKAMMETMVRIGYPSREIVEAAVSLPADLIVISTHGHTGLKHALLGSVAEHVVQRAPCPVLVVREHEREMLAA